MSMMTMIYSRGKELLALPYYDITSSFSNGSQRTFLVNNVVRFTILS